MATRVGTHRGLLTVQTTLRSVPRRFARCHDASLGATTLRSVPRRFARCYDASLGAKHEWCCCQAVGDPSAPSASPPSGHGSFDARLVRSFRWMQATRLPEVRERHPTPIAKPLGVSPVRMSKMTVGLVASDLEKHC
jgi:hypothetical protein